MNATTHAIAPEEIMAYLDGELPAVRVQFASEHVGSCPDCRAQVQELQSTSQKLLSWKVGALPSPIETGVQAATRGSVPRRSLGTRIFLDFSFWTWKQWLGASVATVFTLVLLFVFLSTSSYRMATPKSYKFDIPAKHRELNPNSVENARIAPSGAPKAQGDSTVAAGKFEAPMIARTVSLALLVKDFDNSRKSLDSLVARHQGYSANLSVSNPQGAARSLQASLRIPASELTPALIELKSLGHVESESQNGEEVTQQHADLVARLKNSRETERRLQAILDQRTGKISDVLAVEQEIARVRGEIEQMEAEQKNLEHRVEFATINIELTEEYKAQLNSPVPSATTQLRNATVSGFRNAFESLLSLLLFLTASVPVLLLWLILLFFPARFVWRRYRRALAS
jgi:hypothetical protein